MTPLLYALPAEPGRESEDAAAIGEGIAVVVDGAGLPKSSRQGCGHSVSWYARSLAEAFRVRLADRATSMVDALAGAIAEVTASHAETCDLTLGSPSATVAAWRVDGDVVEHLVLSDASIVLIGRGAEGGDGVVREITDPRIDAAVRTSTEALLGAGAHTDDEILAARFAAHELTRNVDGGFWCCQTDPVAAAHAHTGTTPLTSLAGIVAASDGGTRGFQLVRAHSIEDFARSALEGRLADIAAQIRAGENASRLGPFTKPHDDITLVSAVIDQR